MANVGNAAAGQVLIGAGNTSSSRFASIGTNSGLTGILIGNTNSAFTANPITNHAVLIGGASNAITSLGPTATAGQILQSGGLLSNPSFSTAAYPTNAGTSGTILQSNGANIVNTTATYPGTSGTSGTILRSNGTNIVNSTATFADTYTASNLLYSNGSNTVTGLATANSAALVTTSAGVPVMTSSLTNGQILTGITGQTPKGITTWMMSGLGSCYFWNLGFTLTGGNLVVSGADGTALSSTNPAFVVMQSNVSTGRLAIYTFTSNQTLTASDLTNNLFGTTVSVAWSSVMPWYVGVVADSSDANPHFCVCRIPSLQLTPTASTDMGCPGTANADVDNSVFIFDSVTLTNYTDKYVGFVGTCVTTKDASDVWSFTSFATTPSGVGIWCVGPSFNMVLGQNGATAGRYMRPNGGTVPQWITQTEFYTINPYNGSITVNFYMTGDGGTDGSGAVSAQLAIPTRGYKASVASIVATGNGWENSAGIANTGVQFYTIDDVPTVQFFNLATGSDLTNANFSNGGRTFWGQFTYYMRQRN